MLPRPVSLQLCHEARLLKDLAGSCQMLNRRNFLRNAGGLVGFPLLPHLANGASRPEREAGIVMWAAHSLYAERSKGPINEALVRSWIKHYADHGITAIHWRGSYVGKATYHSKVLPMMKPADKPAYEVSGPWDTSGEAWTKARRRSTRLRKVSRTWTR